MADGLINLYSLDGMHVAHGDSYVNVSNLAGGIYMLTIEKEGNRTAHKIRIGK